MYCFLMAVVIIGLNKKLERILDYKTQFLTIFSFCMENIGNFADKKYSPVIVIII